MHTRRAFLKSGVVLAALGFDLKPVYAQSRELKIARTTETRSTCPYCSVSCGVIIHTLGDKAKNVTPQVVHVEGDPDHPINRGTLCPKGSSLQQDIVERAAPAQAAGAPARFGPLGRHRLGHGHRRDRASGSRRRATRPSSRRTRRAAP